MTRRFEFADEKSHKFWEITVTGTTVTVTYGRIGTNGQTQIKEHATATNAKAAAEKQVAEKVKKGYRESGATAAAKPAAKTSAEAAARTAPATTPGSTKGSASSGGVDAQALAAIWTLLAQHDLASQQQGIALLRALDDPALWASLAEGLSLAEDGRLVIPEGCEVHTRVSGSASSRHGELLALWALRQEGRLAGVAQLNLQGCKYLTDLTPLAGLTDLRTLNLSGCEALTDLTELAGLTGLHELDLSGCTALTDVTPLAGMTGLRTLDLHGCAALTDLTPLAGLTSCFPSVPSLTDLEFEVLSSFHSDLWHYVNAGPWRVRIPGFEASDDPSRFTLPLSHPILVALRECLDAEAARGEGLRNLNVFLTSIGSGQEDWERLHSKRGETRWSFDKVELYFEEQRIQSWWNGTKTDYHTYDIDDPMPEGQFTIYGYGSDADAEVAVPSESLAVLVELIDEVRALRDADSDGDYLSEDDRENGFDALSACSLTVHPSQWGVIITEHDSWGRIGRGEAADWEEVPPGITLLEEIRILLERVGSAVPQVSARKKLFPVVLCSTIIEDEDAKERKWTAAERKRRLQLARMAVEQFAAAASATLDAVSVYLFVGTANGEPDAPGRITFTPSACHAGTGRWWRVEDALDTWLDASKKACLDAIDEHFLRYDEGITIGIYTPLPFVASHRGCAISEILDGANLGRDHEFNGVSVYDGEPHWFRYQRYAEGELDSGFFTGFSDDGGNDRESVKRSFLDTNSGSPDEPYGDQRLRQLLSEAAAQADA